MQPHVTMSYIYHFMSLLSAGVTYTVSVINMLSTWWLPLVMLASSEALLAPLLKVEEKINGKYLVKIKVSINTLTHQLANLKLSTQISKLKSLN